MAVDTITHFRVERSIDGVNWVLLSDPVPGGGAARSFTDTDTPSPTFFYRLYGYTANGIQIIYNNVSITQAAQGGFQWVRTYQTVTAAGQHQTDQAIGVCSDPLGNVYLTGDAGNGLFLRKYSHTGTLLWSQQHDGSSGKSVACDPSGNLYLTGFFFGAINFGTGWLPGSGIYAVIFVAKFDPTGACLWAKSYPTDYNGPGIGLSLALNSSGSVYVTGPQNGTINFGSGPVNTGAFNVFLLKLNGADGATMSYRLFPSPSPSGGGSEGGRCLSIGPSDVVWLTGCFQGSINFGGSTIYSNAPSGNPGLDLFVAKFDQNLNHLFSRGYIGSQAEFGNAIVATSDGGAVFGGAFGNGNQGTLDLLGVVLTNHSFGNTFLGGSGFICKITAAGDFVWAKQLEGNAMALNRVLSLNKDTSGNILVGGVVSGTFNLGGENVSAGYNDAVVIKLDSLGNFKWAKTYGDTGSDSIICVSTDPSGNVLCAGVWIGTINFGDGNKTGPAGDAFLLKLSP